MKYRIESDSLGEKRIESGEYWGCRTRRRPANYPVGTENFHRIARPIS
jgi:fumarate hydratase class II